MFSSCTSPVGVVKSCFKMLFGNLTTSKLIRHLTLVSIVGLIVISVYYLNMSLEFLKKLIEHINDVDQTFAKHAAKNLTLSKMMFEPMQRNANEMYQKHEPAAVVNIISFSALIALSAAGLVVALRKQPSYLIIYGVGLDAVYATSFLYVSRLKPWICAFVVFVSILAYIHSRQLLQEQKANKVSILQTNSDGSLIKAHKDYKYEHTSEVV